MKKIVRSLALVLALVTLCVSLVSCTKIMFGSYTAKVELLGQSVEQTYTFSPFGKVTRTEKATVLGVTTTTENEGKYTIAENADGELEITLSFANEDGDSVETTVAFEKGEDFVKIGLVEYKKA